MSLSRAVRVQCDGPCRGWLSRTDDYMLGTECLPRHNIVKPTAGHAWLWPDWISAFNGARRAGWFTHRVFDPMTAIVVCPACCGREAA